MTSTPPVERINAPEPQRGSGSWGEVAFGLARDISDLANQRRGDLADLRRMNIDGPEPAVFWRLMARHDLLDRGPSLENSWKLVLHGIALMTPTNSGDGNPRRAHDGYIPVGRALFLGGDPQREKGLYSETRLNRLLTARGPVLRILLARMFRMLATKDVSFNWREMAQFILNDGFDEEAAEQSRRRIAREYYQAERRNSRTSE